jgi:uncharacterized membrane protein
MNLNGRICLKHTIYWAVFSVIYVYAIGPIYYYMIDFIPQNVRYIMIGVIFAVFSVALFFTVRAALGVQKIMAKTEALRTSVMLAGEYVKAKAENLKGSTLAKYDEFRDTVASTPERFEEWRAEVSRQINNYRAQLDDIADGKKSKEFPARVQRFFRISPGISEKLERTVKDLEERWEDFKKKYGGSDKDGK